MKLLRSVLRALLAPLVGAVLIFEEWGWQPLQRLLGRLARMPLWARLEALIARLPPWAALLAFLTPTAVLLPAKLLALYWIAHGHQLAGVALVIAAKLLGTAFVARLFMLTKPALMQFGWFATWYPRWVVWKDGIIAQVKASWYWRAPSALGRRGWRLMKRLWRGWRGAQPGS